MKTLDCSYQMRYGALALGTFKTLKAIKSNVEGSTTSAPARRLLVRKAGQRDDQRNEQRDERYHHDHNNRRDEPGDEQRNQRDEQHQRNNQREVMGWRLGLAATFEDYA